MCVGLPLRVSAVDGVRLICCDGRGGTVAVDGRLVGPVRPGTWVMTFAGAARAVMTDEAARHALDALAALEALMIGETPDLNALFADLADREPELPDFLRPAAKKEKA